MRLVALAIIALGLAFAVATAVASGFEVFTVVILAFLIGLGVLGIAVVRRSANPTIVPGRCPECSGVVSSNAPYCKHCGARLSPG